ncbi:unnamed protein product [Urochloa humidicola]
MACRVSNATTPTGGDAAAPASGATGPPSSEEASVPAATRRRVHQLPRPLGGVGRGALSRPRCRARGLRRLGGCGGTWAPGFLAPLAVDACGVLLMSVDDEDVYRYNKENRVLEKVADLQQVSRNVRWNWNGSRGEDDGVAPCSCSGVVQSSSLNCPLRRESGVSISTFM